MSSSPKITLYFLQASRCIRTAWLLEELNLDYEVVFAERENNKAPEELKKKAGTSMGFPVLKDGDLKLLESGAITEYLLETYDKNNTYLPLDPPSRAKVREWIHAAEATYMLHAIPILYARWNITDAGKTNGELEHIEKGMAVNIVRDLNYLEEELGKGNGRFLVGEGVTAADIMMGFSLEIIFSRELGTKGGNWEGVKGYLEGLYELESYKRAVEKTGHSMSSGPR